MTQQRVRGSHRHRIDNIADLATGGAAEGDVLTVVTPGDPPVYMPPATPPSGGRDDPFIVAMAVAL